MTVRVYRHLLRKSRGCSPSVSTLIRDNGVISLERCTDVSLFNFLAKVVSRQQLSSSAADSIFGKLETFASEAGEPLVEVVSEKHRERLLQCGLSRNKVKALLSLKAAFIQGTLVENEGGVPTYAEISRRVTGISGFGQWSADMTAIFYYGIPDVWSEQDVSLRKGISALTGFTAEDCLDFVSHFSPYKSFLALHIWRGIDNGLLR